MSSSLYKFIKGKRVRSLKPKRCDTCKKQFQPKNSSRKYCSPECYHEMKRIRKDRVVWTGEMRQRMSKRYKGEGNPMYGKSSWSKGKKRWEISGKKHWSWKGGYWINKDGYKVIQNNYETGGKKVLEHKKVLEEKLGRKLKSNEVTHHINGDKLDNRPENLEVMTRSEHINHHRKDLIKAQYGNTNL